LSKLLSQLWEGMVGSNAPFGKLDRKGGKRVVIIQAHKKKIGNVREEVVEIRPKGADRSRGFKNEFTNLLRQE